MVGRLYARWHFSFHLFTPSGVVLGVFRFHEADHSTERVYFILPLTVELVG